LELPFGRPAVRELLVANRDRCPRTRPYQLPGRDDSEDLVRVSLELRRSNARDRGEIRPVLAPTLGDLGKRPVVEHDVGRYAVGLRALAAPFLQAVEQRAASADP
jgi:hypothetical protein